MITSLQTNYKLSTDFTGSNYCGLTVDWDYDWKFVDISMPGYVVKALKKIRRTPKTPQYSPHKYARPQYGITIQFAKPPDNSTIATKKETKHVQAVTGTFLYYSYALDHTMIVALNDITAVKSKPTQNTLKNTIDS